MPKKTFNDFVDYCRCGHPGIGCYCRGERWDEARRNYNRYLETLKPSIEDALTVAYVGIVHAMSELKEINPYDHGGLIEGELEEALEDLQNALDMMKPHVSKAQTGGLIEPGSLPVIESPPPYVITHETMQEYMTRLGW